MFSNKKPYLPATLLSMTDFHWDEAKKIFEKNARLKKTEIFNSPNSQFSFAKKSGIDPWVSRNT